jgi:hypothetical protein
MLKGMWKGGVWKRRDVEECANVRKKSSDVKGNEMALVSGGYDLLG